MKYIFIVLVLVISTYAKEITPYRYVEASSAVNDFVLSHNTLVIGTQDGTVEVYDLKRDKLLYTIKIPTFKNILGDNMRSIILSVDYLDGVIVFIARSLDGYRELYIYKEKKLTKLISIEKKTTVQQVKFLDKNRIIVQSMGNEIMLYDLKSKSIIYKKQLNFASFSDFVFSEDKKFIYSADETPAIHKLDITNANEIELFEKANRRDVFSIDYKNNVLLSGGKDKRVIVYKSPTNFKMIKADFFVYAVALSDDAKLGAFVKNENSLISILDISSMKEIHTLLGHKQTIRKIEFIDKDTLITADENKKIFFWKLK